MIDTELHDQRLFVGLDLGTSGLKAVAAGADGSLVAFAGAGYPTARPAPGAAEQDPAHWIAAVREALAALAADAPPARWQAIGLSGMIPTLVTADARGEPAGPAVTWQDSRAEAEADRLRARLGLDGERDGGEALYRVTGQWVDGRYLLPMFARIAAAEPGRAAATSTLLGAKDYLFGWLTGQAATDPSTATGFGCYNLRTGDWDGEVLRAAAALARGDDPPDPPASAAAPGHSAGWRLPCLPPVWPPATTRPLRAELAAAFGCTQIPVCLGAADSVLGALGLGAGGRPGRLRGRDQHRRPRHHRPADPRPVAQVPGHPAGYRRPVGPGDGSARDRQLAALAGRAAGRRPGRGRSARAGSPARAGRRTGGAAVPEPGRAGRAVGSGPHRLGHRADPAPRSPPPGQGPGQRHRAGKPPVPDRARRDRPVPRRAAGRRRQREGRVLPRRPRRCHRPAGGAPAGPGRRLLGPGRRAAGGRGSLAGRRAGQHWPDVRDRA